MFDAIAARGGAAAAVTDEAWLQAMLDAEAALARALAAAGLIGEEDGGGDRGGVPGRPLRRRGDRAGREPGPATRWCR